MERPEFREAVFARDHYLCVVCGEPAADAHHLIERRLWPDGGYHPDNGVSLCPEHHLLAEQTEVSVAALRDAAGITTVLLPATFDDEAEYDKWGNVIWPDGTRSPGPLFKDESVQKVLKGVLGQFRGYYKHARTPHLPWSPNAGADSDRTHDVFGATRELIVVTQKMDGEQTSMYPSHYHARSIESGYHQSRTWVGNLHGRIKHEIPEGWRIVGENLYAAHSIVYHDLPSYFLVFAIFNEENNCLSWDDTEAYAEMLGLQTVPFLYCGAYDRVALESDNSFWSDGRYGEVEGYVVRSAGEFDYFTWCEHVGKVVRKDHVKTDQHWRHRPLATNGLFRAAVGRLVG